MAGGNQKLLICGVFVFKSFNVQMVLNVDFLDALELTFMKIF
jgi:hypothetical protein